MHRWLVVPSHIRAPHPLVLLGFVSFAQAIRAISHQPALKGMKNDVPKPAASVPVIDRQ